ITSCRCATAGGCSTRRTINRSARAATRRRIIMRGRKPKPTSQRRLEGNPGHRPLNLSEPAAGALDEGFDTPPAELTAPRAREEWARLAPLLRKARHVGATDRTALMALCIETARYLDATERVQTSGMVVLTPNGYPMTNPYLS